MKTCVGASVASRELGSGGRISLVVATKALYAVRSIMPIGLLSSLLALLHIVVAFF
jgi:hypothetical protein